MKRKLPVLARYLVAAHGLHPDIAEARADVLHRLIGEEDRIGRMHQSLYRAEFRLEEMTDSFMDEVNPPKAIEY